MRDYILQADNIKSLWLSYNSNKSNLTTVRDPCKWGCSWIIKFLIVWISDIVNMLLLFFQLLEFKMVVATCCMQEGKHLNNIWHFLKKNLFHFDVFSRITFPFECGKAISWWSKSLKCQKKVMPQGDYTNFSKLVNWCPVKKFSLILTTVAINFSEKNWNA